MKSAGLSCKYRVLSSSESKHCILTDISVCITSTGWKSTGGNDYIYDDEFTYSDEHATTTKLALATTVLGATAFGVYFLASCIKFPNFLWLVISLTLVATCVCEGMILGTFADTDWCDETNNCELGKSARCGIAACVFWGLSAFMTCGVFAEANRDDELD